MGMVSLLAFCGAHYRVRICPDGPTDNDELRHVESSFPEFEFRHESLTLPETFPEFHLRDAGVLPSLHEQFDHSLVEIRSK